MHFENAVIGWTNLKYNNKSGLKNKNGELTHPGTLGCSGFVSIVYHRMRYGEDWLNHFDFTIQQKYGDEAAEKMGFPHLGTNVYATWKDDPPGNDLYFFNVRVQNYCHIGYVFINSGNWRAFHYSRMISNGNLLWDGYANCYFEEWFFRSRYKDSPIELYSVLMPPAPPTGLTIIS